MVGLLHFHRKGRRERKGFSFSSRALRFSRLREFLEVGMLDSILQGGGIVSKWG